MADKDKDIDTSVEVQVTLTLKQWLQISAIVSDFVSSKETFMAVIFGNLRRDTFDSIKDAGLKIVDTAQAALDAQT